MRISPLFRKPRPGLFVRAHDVPAELEVLNEHDVSGVRADQQIVIGKPQVRDEFGQLSTHRDGGLAQLALHKANQAHNRLVHDENGRWVSQAEGCLVHWGVVGLSDLYRAHDLGCSLDTSHH